MYMYVNKYECHMLKQFLKLFKNNLQIIYFGNLVIFY